MSTSVLLLVGQLLFSQPVASFPEGFVGNWKGTLEWTQAGANQPRKVSMQLRIQPSPDSIGHFTWHLVYGSTAVDNRPYILKPVDAIRGHWVIDENNGIILDQYWIANRLVGSFTVQNSTIVNSYWLDAGRLMVEFVTYAAKPVSTTGKGDTTVPFVNSYAVKSYQRAELHKEK